MAPRWWRSPSSLCTGTGSRAGVPGGGSTIGVGWFPLGPGEVYVPGYRASARYANRINVSNINIANIDVTNVNVSRARYFNRSHATVVSRDVFIGARSVSARTMLHVPPDDLARASIANTAGEAPQRASLLQTNRVGTVVAHPPAVLVNRSVVARSTPPPPRVPLSRRNGSLPVIKAGQFLLLNCGAFNRRQTELIFARHGRRHRSLRTTRLERRVMEIWCPLPRKIRRNS